MKYSIVFFLSFFLHFSFSQKLVTIHGTVTDASTGEQLIGVVVFEVNKSEGRTSNNYGFYSLSLKPGKVKLQFKYIGYQTETVEIDLTKDILFDVKLKAGLELQEIEITSSKEEKIDRSTRMSTIEVPIEQIKKVPALFGEVDVLKALQLLPGVSGGTEGTSGLYVRGGSPDQNLILLDGVPVYNVYHVGGIFSTFNADALKNVNLTKGGFPARYGGRLSSVLEMNMKEGNINEFHGEGGVGIISSRLTLEGPIKKDKASFMISGRRTYMDVLAKLALKASPENEGEDFKLKLYFYDLNAKVNWKINNKHRLYFSNYLGQDNFYFKYTYKYDSKNYDKSTSGIDWGNVTTAFRWNYAIKPNLFSNTSLTYSRYQFNLFASLEEKYDQDYLEFAAKYFSGIQDFALRSDFDYAPVPNHAIKFGGQVIRHLYKPGAIQIKLNEYDPNDPEEGIKFDSLIGSNKLWTTESSLYVEDDIRLGPFGINVGLHQSTFLTEGKYYYSLQPRLAARYILPKDYTIKASFATMRQYINLLSNEGLGLPTDLWVPSTKKIIPQFSSQVAFGIAKIFHDDYECSIEAFHKKMEHVISYKEGVAFIGLEVDWQDKITQGSGEAKGFEFFVQKKKGKFNGWIGYTLSWNNRTFPEINGGKTYRFKYDRRHDFEIVMNYQLSKRWSSSMSWQYATGNAITLPILKYLSESGPFNDYYAENVLINGSKNAYTMPSYHRLDISFEYRVKKRRYESAWSFGVYNAYNRSNPFFITTGNDVDPVTGKRKAVYKQISLLPLIPNISYNFKF